MGEGQDDETYDMAPGAEWQPPAPAPQAPVPPPARLASGKPILNYRGASPGKASGADTDTIKNLYAPLWLLGGGIVVNFITLLIWTLPYPTLSENLAYFSADLFISTALMLIAMLIAARIRGIQLGPFPAAMLKLAAISVAPSAVCEFFLPLLIFIPFGGFVALGILFVMFFALLGALFDLDESDTWYCVSIIFLVRLGTYFAVKAMFH